MYVSEGGNHRISLFSPDGQFMTSFGKKGVGPGEFNQPRGILVDNSGVVTSATVIITVFYISVCDECWKGGGNIGLYHCTDI